MGGAHVVEKCLEFMAARGLAKRRKVCEFSAASISPLLQTWSGVNRASPEISAGWQSQCRRL